MVCLLAAAPSLAGAADDDQIRDQIERNWNLGALAACPIEKLEPFDLRISLAPDGTVTDIAPHEFAGTDECGRMAFESARRAVMISSPLKLPAGTKYEVLNLRFDLSDALQ